MQPDPAKFSDLVARFETLGSADQKAVLAKMSAEEREAYSNAAARQANERKAEAERLRKADCQYAPYSQWLGEIIEKAAKRDERICDSMSETAIRAIGESHEQLREEAPAPKPILWERIQRLILGPLPQATTKTKYPTRPGPKSEGAL